MDEPLISEDADGGLSSTTYDVAIHLSKLNIEGTVVVRGGENGDDPGGIVSDLLEVFKSSLEYCEKASPVVPKVEALIGNQNGGEEVLNVLRSIVDLVASFSSQSLFNKTDDLVKKSDKQFRNLELQIKRGECASRFCGVVRGILIYAIFALGVLVLFQPSFLIFLALIGAVPSQYTFGEGASAIDKRVQKLERKKWLTSGVTTVANHLRRDIQRCLNSRCKAMEICMAMCSDQDSTGLINEYLSYKGDWLKFTTNFPIDYKESRKYILRLLEEVSRVD